MLDDYTPLRSVTAESLEQEAMLFPVRTAHWYVERRTLGGSEKASQGHSFYTAPNPPFGAVFTYYLRDEIQTRKQARREREKEIDKEGGDTPYPGWEELQKEELEEDPAILITVRDTSGNVVRRLTGPTTAGFHRVAWDLRYPSPDPWSEEEEEEEEDDSSGWLAAPGSYEVDLARSVDGVVTDLGLSETFEVVSLRGATIAGASLDEMVAFKRDIADLQRAFGSARSVIDETKKRLGGISEALLRSSVSDASLDEAASALKKRLAGLKLRLDGSERRDMMGDLGPVPISRRLSVVEVGNAFSAHGPTATHRKSFEIARKQFAELRNELNRLVETDLSALEQKLDAAGVPWTPGRGVPEGH